MEMPRLRFNLYLAVSALILKIWRKVVDKHYEFVE
jgi:hypothetical protein